MKKLLIVIILFLTLYLTGCQIKDQNGEDNFELATYTLDDVKNNNIKGNSNLGSVEFGTFDHGYLKVRKFSGQWSLVIKNIKSSDKVKITSTVEKGNLGIFIKCLDEVYQIPINTEYTFSFDNLSGVCSIVVVGESAKFRIDYDFID